MDTTQWILSIQRLLHHGDHRENKQPKKRKQQNGKRKRKVKKKNAIRFMNRWQNN